MFKQKFLFILLVGLFLILISPTVYAGGWEPYQFQGNERFEYKIVIGEQEFVYILDLKNGPDPDTCEVSYTTRGIKAKDELGQETLFDFYGGYGFSFGLLVMNPMYQMFFTDLDLEIGEKLSFYGAGYIKVMSKETVAERTGFVCHYYQKSEDGDVLVGEWVVDPQLALPIRATLWEDGEVQSQVELIKYVQY